MKTLTEALDRIRIQSPLTKAQTVQVCPIIEREIKRRENARIAVIESNKRRKGERRKPISELSPSGKWRREQRERK